jgi:hypothetical protein
MRGSKCGIALVGGALACASGWQCRSFPLVSDDLDQAREIGRDDKSLGASGYGFAENCRDCETIDDRDGLGRDSRAACASDLERIQRGLVGDRSCFNSLHTDTKPERPCSKFDIDGELTIIGSPALALLCQLLRQSVRPRFHGSALGALR